MRPKLERSRAKSESFDHVENGESVGADRRFLTALAELRKAAKTHSPVLITGESGTGKELAARTVHYSSAYRDGPLLVVNCAGMAPTLIASELFGHEKGAFTDAKEQKIGKIEAAMGGSLFLDEIGDLPLELQGFLLRFLEDKTIERVGGTRHISVDTRIIAATNADLTQRVVQGRLRQDLYYRLNVLPIHLPPLRERGVDSILIARYYLEKFKGEFDRPDLRLDEDAVEVIGRHDWPGNVRELVATLRRAVVMSETDAIGAAALRLRVARTVSMPTTLQASVDHAERTAIQMALIKNNENVNRAARELGVSRVTLYRLMSKHAIVLTSRQRLGPRYGDLVQ